MRCAAVWEWAGHSITPRWCTPVVSGPALLTWTWSSPHAPADADGGAGRSFSLYTTPTSTGHTQSSQPRVQCTVGNQEFVLRANTNLEWQWQWMHWPTVLCIWKLFNCTFMWSIILMGWSSFVVYIEKNANKIIMEIIDCSVSSRKQWLSGAGTGCHQPGLLTLWYNINWLVNMYIATLCTHANKLTLFTSKWGQGTWKLFSWLYCTGDPGCSRG